MSKLLNDEKNILLQLRLISSGMLDYDVERASFENWIPFIFVLNVENGMLMYSFEKNETFTQYELEEFILNVENICQKNTCNKFSFVPLENYFELNLEDLDEDDLFEMELWFNKGVLSEGKTYGFSEGIRFTVNRAALLLFAKELRTELDGVISTENLEQRKLE